MTMNAFHRLDDCVNDIKIASWRAQQMNIHVQQIICTENENQIKLYSCHVILCVTTMQTPTVKKNT